MIKSVWMKLFMYASISFIAPYLVFMAGVYDAWTEDRSVQLNVPIWVWGYITLQALSQTFIVLRAFTDGSYTRHNDEAAAEIKAGQLPPNTPP